MMGVTHMFKIQLAWDISTYFSAKLEKQFPTFLIISTHLCDLNINELGGC